MKLNELYGVWQVDTISPSSVEARAIEIDMKAREVVGTMKKNKKE